MNLPHTVNSTLNPEAAPFFPGRRNHRVAESTASIGQRIQLRSVPNQMPSVSGTPSRRHSTPTTGRNISHPHRFNSQIKQGFKLLDEGQYKEAEEVAKRIQAKNQGHRHEGLATLHARSLISQGSHRAEEAASVLRSHHRFFQPDNSIVLSSNFYINLTMVFIFESLKQYSKAEDVLTKMGRQEKPSHRKHVQLAMVRLQQEKGAYGQAETRLQEMRRKHSSSSALTLTELCGDYKLDLAMVRLQEANGSCDHAETLLQRMRRKHSSNSTLTLTEPCDHYELDLVMVRLQQEKGAYDHAETLLQEMRRKHSSNSTLTLTEFCGDYQLDLAMVRLQEANGAYDHAETLLQRMRRKHSRNSALTLTEFCGDYQLDLAMVRLQEANGAYDHAKALLQEMRRKHSHNNDLMLTEPCGHYELDLAMVRHIDVSNTKNINLDRYFDSYPDSHNFALERLSVCLNKKEWQKHDELAEKLPDSPEKLLSCAIRYFQEYISSYLSADQVPDPKSKESIDRLLKQSLDITQSALKKYPYWSTLISHEGHCLRMLGEAEDVWRGRFERADKLDPGRLRVEKNQDWRIEERKVLGLRKVRITPTIS